MQTIDPKNEFGNLVISLDFEMFWGVRDAVTYEQYKENLENARRVVLRLLELFPKFNVHATWATVGFLFYKNFDELIAGKPAVLPEYANPVLSPYAAFTELKTRNLDHILFAPDLVQKIAATPGQELASHTFSHYYCLEEGQTLAAFQADSAKMEQLGESLGQQIESLVFPRNQTNEIYLKACARNGIKAYRGNEQHYFYTATAGTGQTAVRRAGRLLDSYLNISGHHTFKLKDIKPDVPVNIPASRFFRPYSPKLKQLEGLKIKRIKNDLLHAAKNKEIYHLWWHPHNFGANFDENFRQLEEVLTYYATLADTYGMKALSMKELANLVLTVGNE